MQQISCYTAHSRHVRPLKEKNTKREIPEVKLNNGRGLSGSNLLAGTTLTLVYQHIQIELSMLPVTGFILVRLLFKEFLSLLVSLGTWQASLHTYTCMHAMHAVSRRSQTIRCYSVLPVKLQLILSSAQSFLWHCQ